MVPGLQKEKACHPQANRIHAEDPEGAKRNHSKETSARGIKNETVTPGAGAGLTLGSGGVQETTRRKGKDLQWIPEAKGRGA